MSRRTRLETIARYLWTSPNTLLGLAAAAASLSLPRIHGPIALCYSHRGFAYWFLARRRYCAITLGHLVLMTPEAPEGTLLHEMVHVGQCERWGPLFLPAYLTSMLLARLQGKDPYWENPFEMEARLRQTETLEAHPDSPTTN